MPACKAVHACNSAVTLCTAPLFELCLCRFLWQVQYLVAQGFYVLLDCSYRALMFKTVCALLASVQVPVAGAVPGGPRLLRAAGLCQSPQQGAQHELMFVCSALPLHVIAAVSDRDATEDCQCLHARLCMHALL
jgi:hypothetical protein